jgi:HSP20 family protein
MTRLRDEVVKVLDTLRRSGVQEVYTPRTDIYETDQEVVVVAEVPGLTAKEDLEVGATEDSVIVRGEIRRATEVREDAFTQVERFYGRFSRTLPLPAKVEPQKAEASYRDGLLEIRLPKAEGTRRRTVKVPIH